jgi:hypothetical protein
MGCVPKKEKQMESGYQQATKMAEQYVLKSGYYKKGEFKVLNEPNNATWNWYSSRYPKMYEDFGLKGKNYYAIYFYQESVRDGDIYVFIDKDKPQIIGTFHDGEFKKNIDK